MILMTFENTRDEAAMHEKRHKIILLSGLKRWIIKGWGHIHTSVATYNENNRL